MTKESHQFDAEVGKILHLMIHSLYENSDIFLRELISNASDACDKLRYDAVTKADLLGDDTELGIAISYDIKKKTLTIADNGTGMSRDELIKNLGTIARSGTQNFLGKLTGDSQKDINLIGQFGVGFYSSFMVADKVSVTSCKAGKKKAYTWTSDGKGKFSIEEAKQSHTRGTSVTLHMREGQEEFLDKWRLKHIVTTYSNHIAFPIKLIDEEGNSETVNAASALWMRPKSEISKEQHEEFYRHVGQAGDDPWMILHNKVEGVLEYTNLLYIPSTRPFDLFHPDRMCRVKLYVKRVFITDQNVDILPPYLRFVRGVVDSEDLPLNISRETLQHNAVMQKIRSAITKKILSEIHTKAEKEPEKFAEFWSNFGPVVKEGLCDSLEPRDELLKVCRFYSTASDGLISLNQYKERMKEGQEAIYFITGDELDVLRKSPQLEGFKDKDIEVLLLCDSVDDFWVNVVNEFEGIELRSVTRVGDELSDVTSKEDTEIKNKKSKTSKKIDTLVTFIKDTLGDEIKDVRLSQKLTESPVCLAVPEGAMDIRMERFLVENKQLPGKMAKILEINPNHKIIKSLAKELEQSTNKKKIQDTIFLLFGQASILEGDSLSDAAEFSRRMNKMLEKALAA